MPTLCPEKILRTLVCLTALGTSARAQVIPPPEPGRPPTKAVAQQARERALRAVDSGDADAAKRQLTSALWFDPASVELLTALVQLAASDDEAAFWTSELAAACVDDRGQLRPPAPLAKTDRGAALSAEELAPAKVAALRDLTAYAKKLRGRGQRATADRIVATWAAAVATELLRTSPQLRTFADAYAPLLRQLEPKATTFLKALEKALDRARRKGDDARAIRLAHCLRGLGRQAQFKDLQGSPPPNFDRAAEAATDLLADLRAEQDQLLTLEQLEEMDEHQAAEFTRLHADPAQPGACMSERELYRVETTCGFETLLGVATTVDLHHGRLVTWYGQDPFDRPGIVRVVPEASDLESEGSPFWWAGGFQSGDLTVLRFSCSSIESLGHGLTHELTHRFDGAIYPGLPAWLSEGRAVWTASAYGGSRDPDFLATHCNFRTMESTLVKGYGAARNLQRLLEGTIDDYRDNYTAGYSLFVYLNTWIEDGKLPYSDALERFMNNARTPKGGTFAAFLKHFVDGKDGRPKEFGDFANQFGEFLRGFYWDSRAPWVEQRYIGEIKSGKSPRVLDRPTWTWRRKRAEPFFGQDQAALAGDLLASDDPAGAAAAYLFALTVDEWHTARAERLARLLDRQGQAMAAWALRRPAAAEGSSIDSLGPAPHLNRLEALTGYLDALSAAARSAAAHDRPLTARRHADDHDRLAVLCGLPTLGDIPSAKSSPDRPFERARDLGRHGYHEVSLTGFEERRVKGLWFVTPEGDVHVGRKSEREGTGQLDRSARQRHAYLETREHFAPGRTVWRGRIHLTTSFVDGAIVFGSTRRDRNVRVRFTAGDWLYAVGKKEEANQIEAVRVRVDGLHEREGALRGSLPGQRVKFDRPTSSFGVEVVVDGPSLRLFVNDQFLGNYATPDRRPIEGAIGFAVSQGAYRVQQPTLVHAHRTRLLGDCNGRAAPGLGLDRATTGSAAEIANLPTLGIPPHENGTLVLWIPQQVDWAAGEVDTEMTSFAAQRSASTAGDLLERHGLPQPIVLVVPDSLPEDERESLARELSQDGAQEVTLRVHPSLPVELPDDLGQGELPSTTPKILFLDPYGNARAATDFLPTFPTLPEAIRDWARVFQYGLGPERTTASEEND